jgi:gluconolactonase
VTTHFLTTLIFALGADGEVIPGVGPGGELRQAASGLVFTEGPVAGPDGSLYFSDPPRQMIYQLLADGTRQTILQRSRLCNGLAVNEKGKIIACQGGLGKIVSIDPTTAELSVIAETYQGTRFNQPNDLVLDSAGGLYFTDPVYGLPNMPQKTMGLYYVDSKGNAKRLAEGLDLPNGIGLSPDGKTLYVVTMGAREVMAFSIGSPGKVSNGRTFCTTETGGDGMTVDGKGNVYVTQPDLSAIDVFDSTGEKLGRLKLPGKPANCAFGGKDGKTLFVTARKVILAIPMQVAGIGW